MKKARFLIALLALTVFSPPGPGCGQSPGSEAGLPQEASPKVKALVESLHSFDPVERRNAARELGGMGEQAVPAIPLLIRALGDRARLAVRPTAGEGGSSSVAEAAMQALANIGIPAVGPLIGSLKSDDPGVRTMAATALGRIRDPRVIEPLIGVLERDEDPLVQAAAVDALRGKKDPRVLEALLVAERNGNWVVRSLAKSAVEEAAAPVGREALSTSTEKTPPLRQDRTVDEEDEAGQKKGVGPAPESPDKEAADGDVRPQGGEVPQTEEAQTAQSAGETSYTVQRDETLYHIGQKFGVRWQTLMEVNDLRDPTDLYVGQVLKIPVRPERSGTRDEPSMKGRTAGAEVAYVVQPGDNLFRIGLKYGVPWQTLMKHNKLQDPSELAAGMRLRIPPWNAARASSEGQDVTTYTVQPGDILYDIGLLFGMRWQEIAAVNGITDPNQIYVGQVLEIPARGSRRIAPEAPPPASPGVSNEGPEP